MDWNYWNDFDIIEIDSLIIRLGVAQTLLPTIVIGNNENIIKLTEY